MDEISQRPTKVLLVEEEPDDIHALRKSFFQARQGTLDLEWAGELSVALERLSRGGIDVVLLNLDLPDSEGIVTFERTQAFAPDVPIVVLSSDDDPTTAMNIVQGGAQDYLVRDEADANALVRSVRYAIERHRLLSALRSLSLIDDLTGLYNRRGFVDLGEQHMSLARRTHRGVTLVYIDLDRFKTINDTLGHHVGDRALRKVTEVLRATFRRSDLIARMGGDEFAVLALEASGDDSKLLIRRLREQVEEFNRTTREPYQLSLSVGMSRFDGESRMRLDELLAQADGAMNEEKREKRRRLDPHSSAAADSPDIDVISLS